MEQAEAQAYRPGNYLKIVLAWKLELYQIQLQVFSSVKNLKIQITYNMNKLLKDEMMLTFSIPSRFISSNTSVINSVDILVWKKS